MPAATKPDAEQLMNDYFAVRRGDLSKLDVIAESFTFHQATDEIHGPDGLVAMQEEIERAFPDGTLEVQDMLVSDDVAFWDWTMTGTHEGAFNGIEPTGGTVAITGISKTTIADGKIQENWAYFDTQDLMAQLGMVGEGAVAE